MTNVHLAQRTSATLEVKTALEDVSDHTELMKLQASLGEQFETGVYVGLVVQCKTSVNMQKCDFLCSSRF